MRGDLFNRLLHGGGVGDINRNAQRLAARPADLLYNGGGPILAQLKDCHFGPIGR